MKTSVKKHRNRRGAGPASRASAQRKASPDTSHANSGQGRLMRDIENSAAMTLQRRRLEQSFNQPLQRQEDEEELQMQQLPIQRQADGLEEEEELMQGKFDPMQRQEEEELQMQSAPLQRQADGLEEEEPLQGRFESIQCQEEEELLQGKAESPLQREPQSAPPNRTGMPDNLKAGVESLSGQDLSAVRVHYDSPKPRQFDALAYAQGNEIHLGAGQEKHLPHEAWHTVQQREGRVEPTIEMNGEKINDDSSLEREADVMGARAMQYRKK